MKTKAIILTVLLIMSIGTAMAVNTSPGISSTSGSVDINFDTTPPAEVTDLRPTDTTYNSITWSWTNPTDTDFANTLINVTKTSSGTIIVENVKVLGTPGSTGTYTATGLEPGTSYTITVRTQDDAPEIKEIKLCTKAVNEGNPWGYCTDSSVSNGLFVYETSGETLRFKAGGGNLALPAGTSYSLIYYKDSDAEHKLPSTKPVNVLATSTSTPEGYVLFANSINIGKIPAADDVNPRGKIWIVPTSEINSDGTLKWSGYGQGNTMVDYLFENDSNTSLMPPFSMGGITYNP